MMLHDFIKLHSHVKIYRIDYSQIWQEYRILKFSYKIPAQTQNNLKVIYSYKFMRVSFKLLKMHTKFVLKIKNIFILWINVKIQNKIKKFELY